MAKKRSAASLIPLLVLACISRADAARNFSKYAVLPQPEAPVQITLCAAGVQDSDVGNVDYYIVTEVTFQDTTAYQTATAVRFRFDLYNSFNEHLTALYGIKEGTFSPGVLIQPKSGGIMNVTLPDFSFINIWDTATQIICSVDTVAFSDGTIWRADFNHDLNEAVHPNVSPTPTWTLPPYTPPTSSP